MHTSDCSQGANPTAHAQNDLNDNMTMGARSRIPGHAKNEETECYTQAANSDYGNGTLHARFGDKYIIEVLRVLPRAAC